MERAQSWDAFLRIDNAMVVDVLTSIASALSTNGHLSSKDVDNLRLNLSGLQTSSEAAADPILAQLEKQNSEFLAIMLARYGVINLYQNVLRHTLRDNLETSIKTLKGFGSHLLERAHLLFNRPLYIRYEQHTERRVLFAGFLIEQVEAICEACQELEGVLDDLKTMSPHDMAAYSDVDEAIDKSAAEALGFDRIEGNTLPFLTENLAKHKIVAVLKIVASTMQDCIDQLAANSGSVPAAQLGMLCESLASEANLIDSIKLPKTSSLELMEVRRHTLLVSMMKVNGLLTRLTDLYRECVGKMSSDVAKAKVEIPQDVVRYLSSLLLADGTSSSKAHQAVIDLINYCHAHGVAPTELINSELRKINIHLSERVLTEFQRIYADVNLSNLAAPKKKRNLERVAVLTGLLSNSQAKATLLIALCLLNFGCGFKTPYLKSEIKEARPEVPYRTTPTETQTKSEEPAKPTNN